MVAWVCSTSVCSARLAIMCMRTAGCSAGRSRHQASRSMAWAINFVGVPVEAGSQVADVGDVHSPATSVTAARADVIVDDALVLGVGSNERLDGQVVIARGMPRVFSVSVKLNTAIRRAIDEDRGCRSRIGSTVVRTWPRPLTPRSRTPRMRQPCDLLVRRVRPTPGSQLAIDEVFDDHAILTDRDGDTLVLEADHRAHAVVELTIRDVKAGGPDHVPSGKFGANAAWLGGQAWPCWPTTSADGCSRPPASRGSVPPWPACRPSWWRCPPGWSTPADGSSYERRRTGPGGAGIGATRLRQHWSASPRFPHPPPDAPLSDRSSQTPSTPPPGPRPGPSACPKTVHPVSPARPRATRDAPPWRIAPRQHPPQPHRY